MNKDKIPNVEFIDPSSPDDLIRRYKPELNFKDEKGEAIILEAETLEIITQELYSQIPSFLFKDSKITFIVTDDTTLYGNALMYANRSRDTILTNVIIRVTPINFETFKVNPIQRVHLVLSNYEITLLFHELGHGLIHRIYSVTTPGNSLDETISELRYMQNALRLREDSGMDIDETIRYARLAVSGYLKNKYSNKSEREAWFFYLYFAGVQEIWLWLEQCLRDLHSDNKLFQDADNFVYRIVYGSVYRFVTFLPEPRIFSLIKDVGVDSRDAILQIIRELVVSTMNPEAFKAAYKEYFVED